MKVGLRVEHTLVSLIGSVSRGQVTQPWWAVVGRWVLFRSRWGRPASLHLPLSHHCPHSASQEAEPSLPFFTGCPSTVPSTLPLTPPPQLGSTPLSSEAFPDPHFLPCLSILSFLFRELTMICNCTYIDLFIFICVSPVGWSLLWYTRAVSHTSYACIRTRTYRRGLACLACSSGPVNNCLLN